MIKLIVVRHGEAVAQAVTDAARELTPRGEQEARAVGAWLAAEIPVLQRAIASPYVRAQQTAQIALGAYADEFVIETSPLVTPAGDPELLDEVLQSYLGETVLVVTHNPLASILTNRLVYGAVGGPVSFGTGSLAILESDVIAPGVAQLNRFLLNQNLV